MLITFVVTDMTGSFSFLLSNTRGFAVVVAAVAASTSVPDLFLCTLLT